MTSFSQEEITCALCGTPAVIHSLRSTNAMGLPDLDGRPPPMARSTNGALIHSCRSCHYTWYDISSASPVARSVVESDGYRAQRIDPSYPQLANRYLLVAMLHEAAGEPSMAARACQRAAWAADDAELDVAAVRCRERASVFTRTALQRSPKPNEAKTMSLILVDLLRRSHQLEAARSVLTDASRMNLTEAEISLLKYHAVLIDRRDFAAHTMDDAITPPGGLLTARDKEPVLEYLARNYYTRLTRLEHKALRTRWVLLEEGEGWETNDPEIIALLGMGLPALATHIAERLRALDPKVVISRCPKCASLTRKSSAKQCARCGHSWHRVAASS